MNNNKTIKKELENYFPHVAEEVIDDFAIAFNKINKKIFICQDGYNLNFTIIKAVSKEEAKKVFYKRFLSNIEDSFYTFEEYEKIYKPSIEEMKEDVIKLIVYS
jgi:hypothetical protein